LRFEETNPSVQCRMIDKETRRKDRLHIKESLEAMGVSDRANHIATARSAMAALEPCHRTYAEWREARCRSVPSVPTELGTACETYPATTTEISQADSAKMPTDLALHLLEHTTDAETKNRLVQAIVDAYAA
jgi:hypothetical protein